MWYDVCINHRWITFLTYREAFDIIKSKFSWYHNDQINDFLLCAKLLKYRNKPFFVSHNLQISYSKD